jgi:hypothetical protein
MSESNDLHETFVESPADRLTDTSTTVQDQTEAILEDVNVRTGRSTRSLRHLFRKSATEAWGGVDETKDLMERMGPDQLTGKPIELFSDPSSFEIPQFLKDRKLAFGAAALAGALLIGIGVKSCAGDDDGESSQDAVAEITPTTLPVTEIQPEIIAVFPNSFNFKDDAGKDLGTYECGVIKITEAEYLLEAGFTGLDHFLNRNRDTFLSELLVDDPATTQTESQSELRAKKAREFILTLRNAYGLADGGTINGFRVPALDLEIQYLDQTVTNEEIGELICNRIA